MLCDKLNDLGDIFQVKYVLTQFVLAKCKGQQESMIHTKTKLRHSYFIENKPYKRKSERLLQRG